MFSDIGELVRYVHVDPRYIPALKRLPGPYTYIFPAKKKLPDGVISPDIGLGVRIPDHPLAREIARRFGGPVITTSVNRTGEPPLVDPKDIIGVFGEEADLFIDAGLVSRGASTVITFLTHPPKQLRAGVGKTDFLREIK
jgi:tRNA threonylcarbamoyl adenosine modification protein (Sua5/YciO/YrdC/YwlC family)